MVNFLVLIAEAASNRGPGMALVTSSDFFRRVTDIVVPLVENQLRGFRANYSGVLNASVISLGYALDDFHINGIDLNTAQTGISFKHKLFEMNITNFLLKCSANASFSTTL